MREGGSGANSSGFKPKPDGITRTRGTRHLAKTYVTNCGLSKEYLQDQGLVLYAHCGSGFTIRLSPDDFYEPPRADPHAWWCGEGRLKTVPYPIMPRP
jgi:hypothetical protein